ncbi:MAG: universal stress protein [Pseudonocardiaceae bacterium]
MSIDSTTSARARIVVGVDGSEPSKHALAWARFLAQATGSGIVVVAAWQAFTGYGWMGVGLAPMPADWNPADDAEKALVATVDDVFGGHRPPGLEIMVREGNPAQTLLKQSEGARMLLVGNRGHGGFSGLLLGSVSAACIAHATCPVLVLHGTTPPPTPALTRTEVTS